ncbi:MAG TPA: glycosyltransferase family 87 protein [Chloroflexia bacterium]|nr:glycosyltransferase family 87 protein [Chloroflexia bacterium]
MSASAPDDRTADPIERERALMDRDITVSPGTPEASENTGYADRWTLLSKLAIALSVGLIAGYLLLWARTVQTHGGPDNYVRITDFISVLTGATIIRDGNGSLLYDLQTQRDAQFRVRGPLAAEGDKLLPYNHVPFEALAVAPFADLPYPVIFAIWTMLAGLSIGMSLGMMDGALPGARPLGWVMSMAACSYLPLIRGLMLGQNSPLVLFGLCATYVALKRGQPGWAGVALLLVALKPQILPVVLLLMLLQRRWRALGVFIGLMLGLTVAAMAILGPGWPLQYANLLLGVAGWSDTAAIDPAIMHNWRGFATSLFGPDSPLVTPVYTLLSLLSVGLIVLAWRKSDVHHNKSEHPTELHSPPDNSDLLWALGGIVAVLVSLHLNPHDLTLLIFPGWILGTYAASGIAGRSLSRLWLVILWAGYAILPLAFIAQGASDNTSIVVVPSVLLMAGAALLLTTQIARGHSEARVSAPGPAQA